MKISALLFLILIKATVSLAQTNRLQIVDLKPGYDENCFPKVIYKENTKVEEKINTFLQVKELELIPGVFKKHPFEKVGHDQKNCCAGTFFAGWKQNTAPVNILSLSLYGETTTAYLSSFENNYNFDLTTGNLILFSNLFTKAGEAELLKVLATMVTNSIKAHLDKLNITSKKSLKKEEKESIKDQIDRYNYCLKLTPYVSRSSVEFFFDKNQITFLVKGCNRNDELGDFKNSFSFEEIEKYLTTYGKNLINQKDQINFLLPQGKMYKGKIGGKFEISAIIYESHPGYEPNYGDNLDMYYWYNNVKAPIELLGDFKNNQFSLSEKVYDKKKDEHKTQANIKAKWIDNKRISGTWTNVKTKKVFSFELEEY